ncbi:thiamine pyrophosphate-dependent enzyme [Acidaminobacter sp.]|uniref:thiamine pyrophosphate-dependent enzyme n=1 Tax=Acidaminobacter sp. TaxID=1872102 RepID=UPI0025BB44EA|nr:thiamine pyrophosphate-dependent enzyme [Acidaminobacter sp.]
MAANANMNTSVKTKVNIKPRKVPALIDRPMSFCPGCGHGIIIRLIAECLEELGQDDNVIFGIGVGCSSLLGGGLETDRLHCSHGRAGAVCTAMKRVNPDNVVISYQGDGDAYSIGIGETTSAAYRNERFTTFVVNNTNYGMTGGQMSNTTMPGQKTTTSPEGRDCTTTGMPLRFPELVASQFDAAAYVARGSVSTPANINKTKTYIKKALEAQLSGEGYSVVEILSSCPTNWGMTAPDAMKHLDQAVTPHFPLGEFKTRANEQREVK